MCFPNFLARVNPGPKKSAFGLGLIRGQERGFQGERLTAIPIWVFFFCFFFYSYKKV